jgi:hypothetical protein
MAIDFTNVLQTIDALFDQNPEEEKEEEVVNPTETPSINGEEVIIEGTQRPAFDPFKIQEAKKIGNEIPIEEAVGTEVPSDEEELNEELVTDIEISKTINQKLSQNKLDFTNEDKIYNFSAEIFKNTLANDLEITKIQEAILKENEEILKQKQQDLQKELSGYTSYVFPKNYFSAISAAFGIGAYEHDEFTVTPGKEEMENKLELANREYTDFVNNLIISDPRFEERLKLIENSINNTLSPYVSEAMKAKIKADIRLKRAQTPLTGATGIDDLGFGISATALVQHITGSSPTSPTFNLWRGVEKFLGFDPLELSDAAVTGWETLSTDKFTQSNLMQNLTQKVDKFLSWTQDEDEYNNREGKIEHGGGNNKYFLSSQANKLIDGDNTLVFWDSKKGEISTSFGFGVTSQNVAKWDKKKLANLKKSHGLELMTFGEARELMQADIDENQKFVLDRGVELMQQEHEKGQFTQEQFTDFLWSAAKGNITDAVRFLPKVILKQLPYMAANFFTAGTYTMISEGGNISFDSLRDAAAIDMKIDPMTMTGEQLLAWMDTNPEKANQLMDTAMFAGGAIAGLERAGIGYILKSMSFARGAVTQLLKGNIRKALSQSKHAIGQNLRGGVNESMTEGLQTGVEQYTKGYFNAMEYIQAMGEGFLGGSVLGGFGGVVSGSVAKVVELTQNTRLNLRDPKLYKQANILFNNARKQLDADFSLGNITEVEYDKRLNQLSSDRNALLKIPSYYDVESKQESFTLMNERTKLLNEIEKTDKSIAKPLIDRVNEINKELGEINAAQGLNRQIGSLSGLINESGNITMRAFESSAEANAFIEEQNKTGNWDRRAATDGSGSILQNKTTGEQLIIVDKETSKEVRDVAVADHEFLHALMFQTVKDNPAAAEALGKSLLSYIEQIDTDGLMSENLKERYELYKKQPVDIQYEEALNFLADAFINNEIAVNDGIVEKVGRVIRNLLQNLGLVNIKFKKGKDVYNFVKDYALRRRGGKGLNQAQTKLLTESAVIGKDLGVGVTSQISNIIEQQAGNLDKAFAPQSKKSAQDLMVQYQKEGAKMEEGLVTDLVNQYYALGLKAMGYSRKAGDIEVEKALGFLNAEFPSIAKNYTKINSKTGKPQSLSNYMQVTLGKRGKGFFKEEIERKKKTISKEKLEEKGRQLVDTDSEIDLDQKKKPTEFVKRKFPTDIAAIEKQTANVRPEILTNIKNSVKQFIASSVGKVKAIGGKGKTVITKLDPSSLAKELKAQNKATQIAVRDAIGKGKQYKDFVTKVINDGYIETIPIAAMKKRFKTVKGFNIEKIGRETLGAGTGIYKLSGLNKQALIDFYTKDQSGRRSFIDLLAKGLTIEQFQEVKIDTEFMNDLAFKLKEAKSELTAEEFMNEVERIYDGRTKEKRSLDVVKASKKRQRSYQQTAYKTAARTPMSKLVDLISPSAKKGTWNDKDEKSYRKTRTMLYHYKAGSQMIKNYLTGSNTDIYGQDGAKLRDQELNEPLTKEEIKVLDKMGIPTIVRKGKTYYDQSKAPKNTVDEMVTIDGKEYSVLALSIKEQTGTIRRNKKTTKISYANWSSKKRRQKLNDPEWREYQAAKLRVLKKIAKLIESDLKANPTNKNFWGTWLNGTQNNAAHPVRTLAPIEFLHYRKLPNARMEHTLPANQVGTMIMRMALDGKVDEDFNFIEKDYFQGDISLFNDDLLKTMLEASGQKVNLKTDMPTLFFDIKNPTTWMRYVEKIVWASRTGGINMNEILVWDSKQNKIVTLTEQFGLPLTESEYKYKDGKNTNFGLIRYQNNLLYDVFRGAMTIEEAQTRLNVAVESGVKLAEQIQVEYNGKMLAPGVLPTEATPEYAKDVMFNSAETKVNAFKASKKRKGISVFDFDDTIAKTKEKVIVYAPAFKPGTSQEISMKLTPAEFAERAQQLEDMGASFDFSQFEKVKGAKKGPLADLALKRQGKFGSKDIFILTARPQIAATGIKKFLDGIGLNIPLENITGLEKGTPQAKVEWILNKTAEGYNDFYFADDSLANVKGVKNILEAVDIKNKVFQAKASKKRNLDTEFNKIVEETTGLKAKAKYSPVRARLEGKKKDKGFFKWFGRQLTITPSAEDFMGLMYDLMGSGKQGNRHAKWIRDNLINPYNKAEQTILSAKVTVANDFAALKKAFPSLRSSLKGNPLMDQIGVGPYTKSQAMRVYIWNKQGMEIPGLSKRDQNDLVAAVEADSELNVFADEVILIQKDKQYPAPTNNWAGGTIDSDIMSSIDKTFRRQVMTEFDENTKIIFSEKNMNKLEALYGKKWVDALNDSLRRMKSGSNRPVYQGGGARIVNEMLDWLNGSVGAVMFLNMKSGLLQLISNVNFINWGDNNIYQAAKAFASKEYWPTVMKLMNSDYLVNRRDGLRINVNEAELANAAKDGGMKGAIAYLLDKGFIITRIMDSLAIATGGATFYMNRRDALLQRQNPETGKKYTQAEAEAKAFDDFYAISEESQQSSNPSKISQQQASLAGRVILAFQNVTMQYNRMTKKAIRDLYNRRKKPGMTQRESDLGNLSKIIYYTTIQNIIFNALQQALFAILFDDEDPCEGLSGSKLEKCKNTKTTKAADIANGMADSLLFGLGFGGAAISTVKNVLLKVMEESSYKSPDYEEAVWEIFNVSPVLDSKVRKLRTTAKTFSWNMEEIRKRGWSLDNPTYLAISQLISAATNIPIDRVLRKIMNMRMAMDEETRTWQRVALILGWSSWSVGLPYWGLQSTIDQEEIAIEKAKKDYKNDIRKIKAMGYKKVMARVLKDYDPKDIIELQSPAGTVVYYAKIKKKKK